MEQKIDNIGHLKNMKSYFVHFEKILFTVKSVKQEFRFFKMMDNIRTFLNNVVATLWEFVYQNKQ